MRCAWENYYFALQQIESRVLQLILYTKCNNPNLYKFDFYFARNLHGGTTTQIYHQ